MQETRAEIARDPSPSGPTGHLPHVMGEEFEKRSAALCCMRSSYAIALPAGVGLSRMNFFELLPHHMGEVPGGRRGTLSKRFVPSPSGPVGPPPPYDGGGMILAHASSARRHRPVARCRPAPHIK